MRWLASRAAKTCDPPHGRASPQRPATINGDERLEDGAKLRRLKQAHQDVSQHAGRVAQ